MKMEKFLLTVGVVLLITTSPILGQDNEADGTGEKAPVLPCEEDPFCQRDDWSEEFERICVQTGVATALEARQLEKLIRDSDELQPRLEALAPDKARLYTFRLKSCRSFFVYALQLLDSQETD